LRVSFGGFLLLFVASRLLYLVLIDPGSLIGYAGEELYRDAIAQELVTGLKLPFTEYRTDNHSGGQLVIGALASGFFLLFGPTLFALKLAPLLMFTLALVFWYWTIGRAASERVARYFALLFCFSPPLFTDYSVTAIGFHSESILFSALTVFLLFRMLSDETGSPAFPVLLGLTAGFGLWFAYIYGLTLLAMLVFWLWHDKGVLRRPRVLWFALGFLVGFSPWIVMNLQTDFAGLVIYDKNVWEHFGLAYLWDGLAPPWKLPPVTFLRTIASDDAWDLYRRAVNLLYSLLYLGPILTAGAIHVITGRAAPTEADYSGRGPSETRPSRTHPTRPTLVGFSILYLVDFTLTVQFSDFRAQKYHLPAYPFLFFLVAHSLARCQDAFPRVQRKIHIVFVTSVIVLGLGTHAPVLSLDRPGYALSAKGYAYGWMPVAYWGAHAPSGSVDHKFIAQLVQRPFLSDILPKLSSEDQRELARGIALLLAEAVPLNGQQEDFARIERLVPPGFDRHFYYQLGAAAMEQHRNELPQAVAAVEFVRYRSTAAHHLAMVGIYRLWPEFASLDASPESLVNSPAAVAPELSPHYWRAGTGTIKINP
jgi:dolichyl-phosphate-mannose-protein mannosyltransferase